MELIKKNIHRNGLKGKAVSQITLEDDYNVPDSKYDIVTIIQDKSDIVVSEIKAAEGHAVVRGKLKFQVLYVSDSEENKMQSLSGETDFNETINLDGAEDGDSIKLKWDTEDFTVSMINSRKVSVKAIVTFTLLVEQLVDEETTVEIADAKNVQYINEGMDIVELSVNKKDIFRIKDEIAINSNKPNIYEIVWHSVQPRNVDIKVVENNLSVTGELDAFVLYKGEDEERSIQWLESVIPFSGMVECGGSHDGMIPDIDLLVDHMELEAKPDYDGEQRLINVDVALNLDIRLYEEIHVDVLTDVYCPSMELTPVTADADYESLVVKNFSKCRVADRMKVAGGQSRILQICHGDGTVKIDEIIPIEDGISIEGVIDVNMLYITSDDAVPFNVIRGVVPFNHIIEARGMDDDSIYNLRADIEQMSATMIDSEEIEVKAVINLNALVLNRMTRKIIEDIKEEPLDYGKLEELPGIVGYIVKKGDTLWNLAKKYYTTVDKIKETNELTGDTLKTGERLVIVKDIL